MKTWQDAYVEAHASCEMEHPHQRIEAGIDAAVKYAQSLCAASPWRYDVENAPKDGSYFIMQDNYDGNLHLVKWCQIHDCFTAISGSHHSATSIRAFATLDPPETPNHA